MNDLSFEAQRGIWVLTVETGIPRYALNAILVLMTSRGFPYRPHRKTAGELCRPFHALCQQ